MVVSDILSSTKPYTGQKSTRSQACVRALVEGICFISPVVYDKIYEARKLAKQITMKLQATAA
jgi:hypothetical protein